MQLAKLWIKWVLGLCKKPLLDIVLVLTCLCPRGWGYLRLSGGNLEPISLSLLLFIYFYVLVIYSCTISEFWLCYKICLMLCIFNTVRFLLFTVPKVYHQELRPCIEDVLVYGPETFISSSNVTAEPFMQRFYNFGLSFCLFFIYWSVSSTY